MDPGADYLFEASWEVCNKVGGIYTVVKSKAKLLKGIYKNYFLIGPYVESHARVDFSRQDPPENIKKIFDDLIDSGIKCYYGIWNIKGEPHCILIDSSGLVDKKDYFKKLFWDNFKVDSLVSDWGFDEPMVWSVAVGMLIDSFAYQNHSSKIVGHFHEWLTGFAVLYLKMQDSPVKTVFTTHATMLGRTIAGSGENLYSMLDSINPDEEAKNRGIMDKFSTEKAVAHATDIFTTVSEITGLEAEKLLGRKPDVLVLNGLDISQFPSFEEISIKHREARAIMREFFSYYFYPHYSFDMDQTLNFFIVGRYEYKNKGIDIFLRALNLLNDRLKKENFKKNIMVFFWIPRDVTHTHFSLSNSKANYIQIKDFVGENADNIINHIINHLLTCSLKDFDDLNTIGKDLFNKDFLKSAKRLRLNFMKQGDPLLVTHHSANEDSDHMLNEFKRFGLNNRSTDKVKVIDYPVYLTGVDGLLDLSYYDAILGCHLGVFPSYYEPWGYTPLESAALGVPAITTDLAGFGRFINGKNKKGGIYVLKRLNRSEDDVIEDFASMLYDYCHKSLNERVDQKIFAKNLSALADWNVLIKNYVDAHNLALKK